MITRRELVATALVAPVFPLGSAMPQGVKKKEQAKQADFLFVQTAKGMSFDKSTNKLTLDGISSTTLFFSDRPERIAGNMKTTALVPFWSKGKIVSLNIAERRRLDSGRRRAPAGRSRAAIAGAQGRHSGLHC